MQRDPIGYADSLNLYSYVGNNSVNWTDPLGLLKLYYWEPKSGPNGKWYGHVSVRLDDGTYISYWPSRPLTNPMKDKVPARPPNYDEDKEGEDGREPQVIEIKYLDEGKIKDWWGKGDHGDFSVFNNCSDIAATALSVGGFPIGPYPIYHPELIWNDVNQILNQGWPNPKWWEG